MSTVALTELEAKIDKAIDKDQTRTMAVSSASGGMVFRTMAEVLEFSKLMALGKEALPKFLRCNVGACLAICIQAVEWRMSPFAVANKAYVVNDRVGYESQLIHAVIEQRAPLVGRLRHTYSGEGATRTCTVTGMVRGESEKFSYTSPEIGKITPKNSPLWQTKPDLQLYYNTSRDWARMYFPDVILGVYADDEIAAAHASSVTATVVDRSTPSSLAALTQRLEDEHAEPAVEPEKEAEPVAAPAKSPEYLRLHAALLAADADKLIAILNNEVKGHGELPDSDVNELWALGEHRLGTLRTTGG